MPFDPDRFDKWKKDAWILIPTSILSTLTAVVVYSNLQFQKSNSKIIEQNRVEQTNIATEYEQIEQVNPGLNFKNPIEVGVKVDQYGGRVLKVIESENELKLEDPIIQSALQIAARKIGTNRWRISIVYNSNGILLIEKTPANKIAEIAKLVESLDIGVEFRGYNSIDETIGTDPKAGPPTRLLGEISGIELSDEQFEKLKTSLGLNLGDFNLVPVNQIGSNNRAFVEVFNDK
jgi:hypothetical protein